MDRRTFLKLVAAAGLVGKQVLRCPGCGAPLKSDAQDCPYCGDHFVEEEEGRVEEEEENPPDLYVSLHRRDKTEPDDPAYERQPVWMDLSFDDPLMPIQGNENQVDFPEATRKWGALQYVGFCKDKDSDPKRMVYLTYMKEVHCGDRASFLPGALTIDYSGWRS